MKVKLRKNGSRLFNKGMPAHLAQALGADSIRFPHGSFALGVLTGAYGKGA